MKKVPQKLKPFEQYMVDQHIEINEYWFNALIKPKCRFVDSLIVYSEYDKDRKEDVYRFASVYSVDAEKKEKDVKESCVYCFFVFFKGKLWKYSSMVSVTNLIKYIELDKEWRQHENQLALKRYENERKLDKRKAKIKRIGSRKKVA